MNIRAAHILVEPSEGEMAYGSLPFREQQTLAASCHFGPGKHQLTVPWSV